MSSQAISKPQRSPWSIPLHHPSTLGKLVSLVSFICMFTVLPELMKMLWPLFLECCTTQYTRHLGVILTTNVIGFGTYNLVMWFIYTAKIPFFQQYRSTDKEWLWESEPEKWKAQIKKTMFLVLFNMFVINSLMPLLELPLGGIQYTFRIEDFPKPITILWQFLFAMIVEDTVFYWTHNLLHRPSVYWIHKTHHQYNITATIAATSTHPFQYFLSNSFPTGLGLSLLSKHTEVHFVTMAVWFVFRVIETCQGHSGYEWSWGVLGFLPFKLDSNYHNFHHAYNVGNFGSMFGFWDFIMNTNTQYAKYAIKKQQHQIKSH